MSDPKDNRERMIFIYSNEEKFKSPPCAMCDKSEPVMNKTIWKHEAYCCSDECGFAYRDSVKHAQKELDIVRLRAASARTEVARAEVRLEEAKAREKFKGAT